MSSLVRCPQCDTFVKPSSIDSETCVFCSSTRRRNPIPGVILAAAIAASPGCSDEAKPSPDASSASDGAVYGVAIGDAMQEEADAGPVYGVAIDAMPAANEPDEAPE